MAGRQAKRNPENGDRLVMELYDSITIDGVRRTNDGYLVADAKVARVGIQIYSGREVNKPEMDIVRVLRPESEVFHADAMKSLAHRPITIGHPREPVTADNWKKYAAGQSGDEVVRDGEFIKVPLVMMDQEAIARVERGQRELSVGYVTDLKWESGTDPKYGEYDAIQTKIRANHIATVPFARGGPELRIGDEGVKTMEVKTQTVLVDGLQVVTTEAGAQAIAKLQEDTKKLVADHAAQIAELNKSLATKDAELAKKDAELDAVKEKVIDDAALDARVTARADLVSKAKAIAPSVTTDGKSESEIRKSVVAIKLGDAAIAGKSDAYIDARFDVLAEDLKVVDHQRDVIKSFSKDAAPINVSDAQKAEDEAYAASVKRFQRKSAAA